MSATVALGEKCVPPDMERASEAAKDTRKEEVLGQTVSEQISAHTVARDLLENVAFQDRTASEVELFTDALLQLQKTRLESEMVLSLGQSLMESLTSSLPRDPPSAVKVLCNVILSTPTAIDQEPRLAIFSLKLIHLLWSKYNEKLPAICDLNGFAQILSVALNAESSERRTLAFTVVGETLHDLLSHLTDRQLKTLSEEGVYRDLRILIKYNSEMELFVLRNAIRSIAVFTDVSPCTEDIIAEGFVATIMSCADIVWTNDTMQDCICRILSVHCKNTEFCSELLAQRFLSRAATYLCRECCHHQLFLFLSTLFAAIPGSILSKRCLEEEKFMLIIVTIVHPDSSWSLGDVEDACILLYNIILYATDSPQLVTYSIIKRMEDCATKWPLVCSQWACKAIEAMAQSLIPCEDKNNQLQEEVPHARFEEDKTRCSRAIQFFREDHYLFFVDMLSDQNLCSKPDLLGFVYKGFSAIMLASLDEDIADLCTPSFLTFFTSIFIRDTISFPELATCVIECGYALVSCVVWTEDVVSIKEANFHSAVVHFLEVAKTVEECDSAAVLLRCLVELYNDHFEDLEPFVKCQTTKIIIDVLKSFGCRDGDNSPYIIDLTFILILMADDKSASTELFTAGQLDKLLEVVQGGCSHDVYGRLVFALGSAASRNYARQQALVDCKFHLALLEETKKVAKSIPIDTLCIYSCLETLTVVACNDVAKNQLVTGSCVAVVLDILGNSDCDTDTVFDTGLNLLANLSSAPVIQKQPDTIISLLKMVATILKSDRERTDALIEALATITYSCQEADEMLIWIDQFGITMPLFDVLTMKHLSFRVRQYTSMVVERQFLHVVSTAQIMQGAANRSSPALALPKSQTDIYKAPELDEASKLRLASLGINLSKPILHIGRVYGIDVGDCHSCLKANWAENIVIYPQGLTCHQYQKLIDKSWHRRGGVRLYHSSSCHRVYCTNWETRVNVHKFDYHSHKSYVKVLKRMPLDRLTVETRPAHFSQEAYDLHNKYNLERHDWSPDCEEEYCNNVVNSPITMESIGGIEYGTFHQLYRLDGKLVAVSLIDIVPKGIISVYMWYSLDKEVSKYSFGIYSTLKEIEMVQELSKKNPEMKYYYLQGWNEGNKKLAYKVHYSPEEFYCACITPEWLPSLEDVKRTKMNYLRDHAYDEYKHPLHIGPRAWSEDMACSSFEKDRAKYEQLTGHKPDVSKIVVCLNGIMYMDFGEMIASFDIHKPQQDMMKRRFEEILVSMDPELAQNMIVHLKAHPV